MVRGEGTPDWQAPPAFAQERPLQDLIAASPGLLGIDHGPTAVATEVRMPGAGRADVVVVDAAGDITIIECKLASNSKFRRWVVGQTLEYAAGLWKLDYQDFERSFAARGRSLTRPFQDVDGWEKETFRSAVTQNLEDGAFRLIIAVDRITDELKRTVVFVNTYTPDRVQLLALKLRHGEDGGWVREVCGEDSAEIEPLRPRWPPDRWTLMEGIRSVDSARAAGAVRAAEGPSRLGGGPGTAP